MKALALAGLLAAVRSPAAEPPPAAAPATGADSGAAEARRSMETAGGCAYTRP